MNSHRREARICYAGALTTAALGVHFATVTSWWCVLCFYVTVYLAWCGSHATANHRRVQKQHEQARRAAALDDATLAADERAKFEEITAHWDDKEAA